MRDLAFFEPVTQHPVSWREGEVPSPVFYYDLTSLSVSFLTPLEKIRRLLPSDRLHPLRVTPTKGVTTIVGYEYRDSDIGPYNELLLGFPVSIDWRAPMVLGLRRAETQSAAAYVWHLPVTTEIARDLGIEVAGYPKFLASIEFESSGGWIHCRAEEEGRRILSLSVRRPRVKKVGRRWPVDVLTFREGQVLRSPLVVNIRELGSSMRPANAHLELGDHPVSDELRELDPGRVVSIQYSPNSQAILGGPMEGWPATPGFAETSSREQEEMETSSREQEEILTTG